MLPIDVDQLARKHPSIPRPCLETMVRIVDAHILKAFGENQPRNIVDETANEDAERIPLRLESGGSLPIKFKRAVDRAEGSER